MNQKTIVDSLVKALTNASGSLDDLDALLERAKQDIVKAKDDERKAKEKADAEKKARGLKIADLANRVLDGKPTDDDCALVINTWMKSRGIEGTLTGKDLDEIFTNSDAMTKKATEDIDKAIEEAVNAIGDLLKDLKFEINTKPAAEAKKPKPAVKDDPEDVINRFLKDFGLR